jgi:hypothetical protein
LDAVRHARRHNELLLARHQIREAELEADVAEYNLKAARERKHLADEQYRAAVARKRFISKYR